MIPERIVSATLIDLNTKTRIKLEQRKNSHQEKSSCLFVPDKENVCKPLNGYKVQFRLDWSDCDKNGDPTLDADLFYSNGKPLKDKHQKRLILGDTHHTVKSLNGNRMLRTYHFEKNKIEVEFLLETTNQLIMTGRSRIVK